MSDVRAARGRGEQHASAGQQRALLNARQWLASSWRGAASVSTSHLLSEIKGLRLAARSCTDLLRSPSAPLARTPPRGSQEVPIAAHLRAGRPHSPSTPLTRPFSCDNLCRSPPASPPPPGGGAARPSPFRGALPLADDTDDEDGAPHPSEGAVAGSGWGGHAVATAGSVGAAGLPPPHAAAAAGGAGHHRSASGGYGGSPRDFNSAASAASEPHPGGGFPPPCPAASIAPPADHDAVGRRERSFDSCMAAPVPAVALAAAARANALPAAPGRTHSEQALP